MDTERRSRKGGRLVGVALYRCCETDGVGKGGLHGFTRVTDTIDRKPNWKLKSLVKRGDRTLRAGRSQDPYAAT